MAISSKNRVLYVCWFSDLNSMSENRSAALECLYNCHTTSITYKRIKWLWYNHIMKSLVAGQGCWVVIS
jgi:hypothetical protein